MQLCSTRLSTHKLCQMTGIKQKEEKCSLKALQFAFLKVPGETTWCHLHRWSVKISIGLCLHLAATCNNSSCINGCERVHVRFQQTLIKKIILANAVVWLILKYRFVKCDCKIQQKQKSKTRFSDLTSSHFQQVSGSKMTTTSSVNVVWSRVTCSSML